MVRRKGGLRAFGILEYCGFWQRKAQDEYGKRKVNREWNYEKDAESLKVSKPLILALTIFST